MNLHCIINTQEQSGAEWPRPGEQSLNTGWHTAGWGGPYDGPDSGEGGRDEPAEGEHLYKAAL